MLSVSLNKTFPSFLPTDRIVHTTALLYQSQNEKPHLLRPEFLGGLHKLQKREVLMLHVLVSRRLKAKAIMSTINVPWKETCYSDLRFYQFDER